MERLQVLVTLKRRNRSFNLSLPLYYLYLTCAVVIGFMFFSGALTRFLVNRWTDKGLLNRLVAENSLLRSRLAAYEAATDSFRTFLTAVERMDNRLRAAINLNLIPADVRRMGIGGTAPRTPVPSVDELLRRAGFEERSMAEIAAAVSRQKERLRNLPSIWPVQGWVTSGFGMRDDPWTGSRSMHQGMDIVAPPGTPIVATADGRVSFTGWRPGFGRVVEIDHGYGIQTFYGHCQSIKVNQGARVNRGQPIATVGSSGRATGTHLHYGVRLNGNWVNPASYILSTTP
ncbi:MAG: M23 family metallopeptidase [candidate division WOR-3 bacterium]